MRASPDREGPNVNEQNEQTETTSSERAEPQTEAPTRAGLTQLCWTPAIGQLIDLALAEDLRHGDVTTELVGARNEVQGRIVCREPTVVCGAPLADWLVERVEPDLDLQPEAEEGQALAPGSVLATLNGPADALLRVERTLLNFMMRMCGVATQTRAYVEAVTGTQARIIDTRKTLPGWRVLDKYAVRVGGGGNHRMDLGSGILIKDNHIAACGSITAAVQRARAGAPHTLRVEVEDAPGVTEALEAGAEVLLLDNMTPKQVEQVAQLVGNRCLLEVSGGVNLQTVRYYAEAGAHYISVGALTHSAPGIDLSMEL
jgi:nicotinate-nucleotide pyrophosphorylase (carboxylating)